MELEMEIVDEVADRHYRRILASVYESLGTPIDAKDPAITAGLEAIARISGQSVCTSNIEVYPSLEQALVSCGETHADGIGCGILDAVAQDLAGSELLGEDACEETIALQRFCLLVYDTILYDEKSVLIPWMSVYRIDDREELHCETGPAVAWGEQKEYFWHGQGIDEIVIERPEDVTAEYLRELSAEQRRASYEALGHERALRILGVNPIDTDTIKGLLYELYSDEGAEAWLRMQSPPLQDGSQPYYVEPVHERCTTCREALAWRAGLDVQDEVEYEIET